ncbi:MAG: putative lipid II flippase FtsW [Acidobacteriota bacterium]
MARKLKSDRILFLTTAALVAFSLVMVYSASSALALDKFQQANLFLTKQAVFVLIGILGLGLTMNADYRRYRRPAFVWTLLGISLAALAAVLLVGPPIKGARRWFAVAGVGIQPSELAKVAVIVFCAAVLEKRMDRIDEPVSALRPLAFVLVPVLGLIMLQPDFGTTVTFLAIVGAMVFAAGLPYRYVAALAGCLVPALGVLAVWEPYRLRRLMAYLDPWKDPLGDGFQAIQSIIAVGTGGVAGRGLGESVQKLFYLPEPHTDFIYAVVAEELGLVGATFVLVAFCVITWRGLRVASRAPDRFGAFLAIGLTIMIAAQAFGNISVVLGLLPTKGIALPFVSAGGSSLIMSMAGMGVLLNISQQASAGAWE